MPRPELVLADQCYRWMHLIAGVAPSPLLCGQTEAGRAGTNKEKQG